MCTIGVLPILFGLMVWFFGILGSLRVRWSSGLYVSGASGFVFVFFGALFCGFYS